MRAGLLTSTYLDAMGVQQLKQSYQDHAMDEELQARMYVGRLSRHITRVIGHEIPGVAGLIDGSLVAILVHLKMWWAMKRHSNLDLVLL